MLRASEVSTDATLRKSQETNCYMWLKSGIMIWPS
jgi:hypothetical protein